MVNAFHHYNVLKMNREKSNYMTKDIPLSEKFNLTLNEAASYFGINVKKLRSMANERGSTFALRNGNKMLIKREAFEKYLLSKQSV